MYSGYELWRLRLFSYCVYGLALAALALVVFGAYDNYPTTVLLCGVQVLAVDGACRTCRASPGCRCCKAGKEAAPATSPRPTAASAEVAAAAEPAAVEGDTRVSNIKPEAQHCCSL